jgi:hypothetical protein
MRTEREQLKTERAAFKKFAKRVAELNPSEDSARPRSESRPVTSTGSTAIVSQVEHGESSSAPEAATVKDVRDAYRETVLAVPHYEDEYDEPLVENLEAELGPTLARNLIKGDVVTPQIQAAVLNQTQQAREQRSELLKYAETEFEALFKARRRLREMHETATTIEENLYPRPVRELVQAWDRLEAVATDCEALIHDRQTDIQTGEGTISMWSAQKYFYNPFQWDHPVLSDGLDTLTRIRRAKQNVTKAIYNW